MNKYSLEVMENYPMKRFSDNIAVAHDKFKEIKDSFWMNIMKEVIVFDIKGMLSN